MNLPILIALQWMGNALAFPHRGELPRPTSIAWEPGRATDVLVIKLREDQGLQFENGVLTGPKDITVLQQALQNASPLFKRDPTSIRADRATFDPEKRLSDLTTYLQIRSPNAVAIGNQLLQDPRVETAYLAFLPVAPPVDIPPTTPDFSENQAYLTAAPDGFGFDEGPLWPGGRGENVAIADIEYGWDPEHEDLAATQNATTWGTNYGYYAYHGNAVLGELFGEDNGYGIVGMVPDAEPLVGSPYTDAGQYNVAAAIEGVASMLDAGDVILIEQQSSIFGTYCPVEIDPAVFDAIALAVAKGIVVVEPSGNGALDLDDASLEGWFDPELQDSGAIMVGGGASPLSGHDPRTWFFQGSAYGARIDVQGWYDSIVTATNGDYSPDLFYPNNDDRQAYTASFGGTSGASPMVAAVAAIANSVAWETWGAPWDPADLRAAMISTGTPQPADDLVHIGPQPDLKRLLRTWGTR